MNRRDFLHPVQLAGTAGQVLGLLSEIQPSPPQAEDEETNLLHFSRRAMATTFEVVLPFGTVGATQAAEAALDEIDRIEDQLTVYRENSEVSSLNRRAASVAMPVAQDLFQLLSQSA